MDHDKTRGACSIWPVFFPIYTSILLYCQVSWDNTGKCRPSELNKYILWLVNVWEFAFIWELAKCVREEACVRQTPLSFIHWVTHPFLPNIHNTSNPKPLKLEIWNFYTMFTTSHVSHVTCNMSHKNWFFFFKLAELVCGGSVMNGAYPVKFLFNLTNHIQIMTW